MAVCSSGPLQGHLKVLAAGLKTYDIPPDYSGNHSSSCYLFIMIFNQFLTFVLIYYLIQHIALLYVCSDLHVYSRGEEASVLGPVFGLFESLFR